MCLVTRCLLSLLCSIMGSLSLLYFHCCECWYFIETEPIFSGLGEKLACVYLGNKSFIKISALVPDFLSQTVDILAEKWADTTKLKRQHAGVSTLHAFFMYIRILFFFFSFASIIYAIWTYWGISYYKTKKGSCEGGRMLLRFNH